MLPAGPLSMTTFGEMLSSRQPFSVSPSDSTRELVPVTAKIAMRKSGPITRPVSLISRNGESASLAEDGVSLASLRIFGAAGMPGGVGGVAPRGVPLSRSSAHLARCRVSPRRSLDRTDSSHSTVTGTAPLCPIPAVRNTRRRSAQLVKYSLVSLAMGWRVPQPTMLGFRFQIGSNVSSD